MIDQVMIDAHCDLDILLGLVFVHFPYPGEVKMWYPGLCA